MKSFLIYSIFGFVLISSADDCNSSSESCLECSKTCSWQISDCIEGVGFGCDAANPDNGKVLAMLQAELEWKKKTNTKFSKGLCKDDISCTSLGSGCYKCFARARYCLDANCYNATRSKGFVSGDFNSDNKRDISSTYYYGGNNTTNHVFKSTGTSFSYQGDGGWWSSTGGYDGDRIRGVVSGDFDNDNKDDVAIVYYYGSNTTRIHVLKSTGSSFNYQGSSGWWSSTGGYNGDKIKGVVSGDFDNDNKDDIAIVYYYGSNTTRIHVFKSDGTKFNSQGTNGWWSSTGGYNGDKIKGVVSGDFDNDNKDDIAMIYDYGNFKTTIHVFKSDGTKFNSQGTNGWLSMNSYDASKVNQRVVSGDFNNDDKDDIAAFYDYGNFKTTIHVFKSDGTKFNSQGTNGWLVMNSYDASKITGRLTSGDFDGDNKDDIATLYDYGSNNATVHVFKSDGTKFNSQGTNGWWHCSTP